MWECVGDNAAIEEERREGRRGTFVHTQRSLVVTREREQSRPLINLRQ